MSDSNIGPEDYWEREEERQMAETRRLLKEWEKKKKLEEEANAIPMLPQPQPWKSTLYLPDKEDVAKYELEKREEERKNEEEKERRQLKDCFYVNAAFAALMIVAFLSVVGFAIVQFFPPMSKDSLHGMLIVAFIITIASIMVFYEAIKEYTVDKRIITWKISQGYITPEEGVSQANISKKSFIKKMAILAIIYYIMYLLVTLTIGLIFFVLLALGGVFNYRAVRWRPWNP